MSKCKECPEEGLPEWIMSYADMITILMAFFVVMYSMAGSSKDEAKEEAVMKSLRDRFGPNWMKVASIGPGPYVPENSPLARLTSKGGGKAKKANGKGEARVTSGEHPRVHTLRPGEQTAIGGAVLFSDGESKLGPAQLKQLEVAAAEVGGKPQRIEIRGHTSRRPLPQDSPYRDNWDLAYARCRNTMEELVKLGIDRRRIRLGVAADNEPKISAGDSVVHVQAARVEVFLLNEVVAAENEKPAATTHEKPGEQTKTDSPE